MNFSTPVLQDKKTIQNYLQRVRYYGCEYTFSNLFLWSSYYHTTFAIIEDMLVFRSEGDTLAYTYPIGDKDPKIVLDLIKDDCLKQGIPFCLYGLTTEMVEELKKIYPEEFIFTTDEGTYDYIYLTSDLTTLAGKKYSAKRNHINKIAHLDWVYEEITQDNMQDCIDMAILWCGENRCEEDESKSEEMRVVMQSLKHREELGLIGGLIRLDGKVVAFTLGEPINSDVFVVHIEKAFSTIQGAYPLINREFAKHHLSSYRFINREEDLGIEGLRKAKRSYYPAFLVEKFNGIYKGVTHAV